MKQFGFMSLMVMAALLLTLAFPAAAAGPKAVAAPPASLAVAPAAVAAVPAAAMPPEHPEIRAALDAMENAKRHLHDAANDFGGHKAESIHHLEAAIHEAEICMSMR